MIPRTLLHGLFCSVALATAAQASPEVWLDETFADNERRLQAPPGSVAWTTSSAGSLLTVADGALHQEGGGRCVMAHFAPVESPLYLEPGKMLLLTYRIRLKSPADSAGGLRVGLYHAGSDRVAHDGNQATDFFAKYTGYMGMVNPAPTRGQPLRLMRRLEGGSKLMSELSCYASISETVGALQSMREGEAYLGTLSVRRSESGQTNVITHSFDGGDLVSHQVSTTDSDPLSVFDSVAFHSLSKCTAGFTISEVQVRVVNARE